VSCSALEERQPQDKRATSVALVNNMKIVRKTLLAAAAVSLVIVAVITGAVVGTQKKNAKSASNVRGSALTDGTAPGADVVTPPPDTICEGEVCGKLCCTAAETCSLETIIDATGDTQMFASCKNVSADNLPDDDTVIGPAKPTPAPIKKAELNASLIAAPVDGAVQRQVDVGVWSVLTTLVRTITFSNKLFVCSIAYGPNSRSDFAGVLRPALAHSSFCSV
jgi:hypothetical protein